MTAAEQWADELAAWRIRPEILEAAAESPYGFPVELFRARGDARRDTPTTQRAREALGEGGSLLDVGCGGGAASLPLVPPATALTGVDESEALLEEFRMAAGQRSVEPHTVQGRWPDIAPSVPMADVIVNAHVFYNVPDLGEFALALTAHARRRVVVELSSVHPWAPLGPLWQRVHGEPRPAGPSADLAMAVLAEVGIAAQRDTFRRPTGDRPPLDVSLAFARRRLCLPASRLDEVGPDDLVDLVVEDQVTLWWDV